MNNKLYACGILITMGIMPTIKLHAQANTALSNLAVTSVNADLFPATANARSMGSVAKPWKDLYLGNLLYMGGARFLTFTSSAGLNNTGLGVSSMLNNTTGYSNTGLGASTLKSNTNGYNNVAIGYGSQFTSTNGHNNVSIGALSLYKNTSGVSNSAMGNNALTANTTGNNNMAIGANALYANTTGSANVAIGLRALFSNTTGSNSVAIGDSALLKTNNSYGNVGIGSKALFSNTTGYYNTAIGFQSLYSNTVSGYNTGVGYQTLYFTSGSAFDNTGTGYQALMHTTSGSRNTADGVWALLYNTTGNNNNATGTYALLSNTTGNDNNAVGYYAGYANTTGSGNLALGSNALYANSTTSNNVALGNSALRSFNSTSNGDAANTAVGSNAQYSNNTGTYNTAVGSEALYSNTTGAENSAVGYEALSTNTGTDNTAIGAYAGYYPSQNSTFLGWDAFGLNGVTNSTAVGYHAPTTASNQVRLGDANVTSIGGAVGFSVLSDGRFKKNVKENVPGLDFIKTLRPVTYTYDPTAYRKFMAGNAKDPADDDQSAAGQATKAVTTAADEAKSKIVYTGFIAQEVESAARKANYDFSGVDAPKSEKDYYGLRLSDFVAPLVQAMKELSDKNDSLSAKVERLEQQIGGTGSGSASLSDAKLSQNLPNPFAGSTVIGYTLPVRFGRAKLTVTDMSGRVIKSVALSGTGKGNLNLDASTLSAGVYNYSMYVDEKLVDSKQMILSR